MIFFSYALYVLYDMWPRRHFDMCVYMHRNKKNCFCEKATGKRLLIARTKTSPLHLLFLD